MQKPALRTLRKRRTEFCRLRQVKDLGRLLEIPGYKLKLMALNPEYRHFSLPKADGSHRWIEDPEPTLKYVQRALNQYLQSIYYFSCSPAAYGFVISPPRDPDPRNILTNAQRHLGQAWLYNVDVEDFFHQVSFERVFQRFCGEPFDFDEELAALLAQLCTYQERLPMGAPTSPVLSNFACLEMDQQLVALAEWAGWVYTRFADDMSFSAPQAFDPENLSRVKQIVTENGFSLNPEKEKLYEPETPKVVTGLVLGPDEVELPRDFVTELFGEIQKLSHVVEVQYRFGRPSEWVSDYEDRIEGMLTFAAFILGHDDPMVLQAEKSLAEAQNPKDRYGAFSWLDFGYF